jgi:predicted DNA-binding transcriptional regulator YafY
MKKLRRSQRHRLWRILEMIREGTRTGRLPNSSDFRRELEVCRRTFCNDLDCLRDDENAPIEYDARRHGYYLVDQTWQLPDMRISRGEAFAFLVALRGLEAFRGTPVEGDMRAVMERISSFLEGKVPAQTSNLLDHLSVFGSDFVRQDPDTWYAIARAVNDRESIETLYVPLKGDERTFLLDPFHMVAYRGNWYVLAREQTEGRRLSFAVPRFREIKLTGLHFDWPQDFDPQECFFAGLGFADGGDGSKVRLLCSPIVAAYVAERTWHPSQKCRFRKDGSLELCFRSRGGIEIERFVLSWQPHIRVLAPARLRRRIVEALQRGAAYNALRDIACR